MKKSKEKRQYIEGMKNSLRNTPDNCIELIKTLEAITHVKKADLKPIVTTASVIICLLVMMIFAPACKKNNTTPASTTPAAQTNCMGSVWKYTVTANPAVAVGSIDIVYAIGDGAGNTTFDTTLTSSWSKSITISQPLSGTETGYPITLQVSKLKPIATTTVTLSIYKNNVQAVNPVTSVISGTVVNQTSCQ